MKSFKRRTALLAGTIALLAGLAQATVYRCTASAGCEFEYIDPTTGQWEIKKVDKGSLVDTGAGYVLRGEGWNPV
ncbi:MAG TPA: hypothetical protein VMT18_02780 [Planctomycetota bacterium]|nr:hypothetical protein [Planctomycetota bacterium]